MSHKKYFSDFKVPKQFESEMFYDASWGNDCCPSFIIKDTILETFCSSSEDFAIKVWVDHYDSFARESENPKRYSIVRETPFFDDEKLFETDSLNAVFLWIVKSIDQEKRTIATMHEIYRLTEEVGFLHQYTYGEFGEQLFKIKSLPTSLLVLTENGYVEMRQNREGQDYEVDRNYRCTKVMENIQNLNQCTICGKLTFYECEKCHETN
jgi:hypothetical protein